MSWTEILVTDQGTYTYELEDSAVHLGLYREAKPVPPVKVPKVVPKYLLTRDVKTYVLFDAARNWVKIGRSINPAERLMTLRWAGVDGQILCVFNGNVESGLHHMFREYRVRGEWFRLEGKLEQFLKHPPAEWQSLLLG